MKIDQNTILFFDATCLIAASGSPDGGSGFLLSLCARQLLRGSISQPVLLEAERNIRLKLGNNAASFLLTLDQGLVRESQSVVLKFKALSPGEFIKFFLPHHVSFPKIRE
jgi:hypothetical protein